MLILASALVAVAGASTESAARAQTATVPSPKAVIYPGDVIGENVLVDLPEDDLGSGGPFVRARPEVVGKMARRTLLPGRAIPLAAIGNPRLVRNGAAVRVVYRDGALTIAVAGEALQDGGVGDFVKLRNADSGVTVSGQVQPDGSVQVDGG